MKVLIVDPSGEALDWALRAQDAGHQVRWFIAREKDGGVPLVGKGLVQRVLNWEDHIGWADLVFLADNTKHLKDIDRWRDKGKCIIGPSYQAAQLELNREFGQKVLEQAGAPAIPYTVFDNYFKAEQFVVKSGKRYVSKPFDDGGDKSLSYVSSSTSDMVFMLRKWQKNNKLKGKFILQEFVPGIEMAVGGWFGPGGFNEHVCENWEFKKLMPGDCGPQTGEMGTIVRYVPQKKSKLFQDVLKPTEMALHALGVTGYVDVNCIIAKDGTPYPLEYTVRPGWPTYNIQQSLHEGDPVEWLFDLHYGTDSLRVKDKIACGVVVAVPEFPYSKTPHRDELGIPVYGINQRNKKWIHPCQIMAGTAPYVENGRTKEEQVFISAGDYLLVVSGLGDTVEEACESAHATRKQLTIPCSCLYRNDIGKRLEHQLPELQKHGYALGLKYE